MAKNNNKIKRHLKLGVCTIALSMTLSYATATEITPDRATTGTQQTALADIVWDGGSAQQEGMQQQAHSDEGTEANTSSYTHDAHKSSFWGSRSNDNDPTVLTQAHKDYFKEALNMKDAMVLFLQHNPSIQTAKYNREAVRQEKKQVRGEFLPTLDGQASVGREYKNRDSTPGSTKRYVNNFELNARQNLFRGFSSIGQWKRQHARLHSASERINSQIEFNGLDAIEAYVETYQQRELLKVAEYNVKKHMETLRKIKDRVNAGTSNYSESSKSEARLELAKSTYYSTLDAQQEAEARFESIIGVPPQAIEKPYLAEEYMPKTIEDAIAKAQLYNPTLLALKSDVEAAKENIKVQTAGFYPTVDLEADAIRSNNQGGTRGADREIEGRVVGRYNIFNGGRDVGLRKEAIARYEESKSLYNQELKTVEQEIRTAWALYQSTKTNVPILSKYVKANTRVKDLYIEQFNLGQRSLLNVLDGENELFQSKREYITAQNANIFAGYRLIATMGHLMKSFGIDTSVVN